MSKNQEVERLPPTVADSRVCSLLEFDAILNSLRDTALSSEGRHLLDRQPFLVSRASLDELLTLVGDYRCLLEEATQPSDDLTFPELADLLPRLSIEGTLLESEELLAIAHYARSARKWRRQIIDFSPDGALSGLARRLPTIEEEERAVLRLIDDDGEIREDRAPALAKIGKELRSCQSDARRLAMRLLRGSESNVMWNSDLPTQRDGRLVLAMHANYKGRMEGIVHGASDTGATLYFEPRGLVALNNAAREYEERYRREWLAILRRLTQRLRARIDELIECREIVGRLDLIRVRALYGLRHACVPALPSERRIELIGARHPLLGAAAIPVDLLLDEERRGLLITGPNTGGKTVTLKMMGLLALMNQFGLEIPAAEGSMLPLFDRVAADIGDEQSLRQSLSTFSAHLRSISSIVATASRHSLVLLDELGAGTDPEEGAALAMAILERCRRLGCWTLATTHHGALKQYVWRHDYFGNAAVEFDRERLAPTYRLLIGLPGASHALHIAERVGLPSDIVAEARHLLEAGQSDMASVIERLSNLEYEAQSERRRLERDRTTVEATQRRLQAQAEALEEREGLLEEGRLEEVDRLIDEHRRRIETAITRVESGKREAAPEARREIESLSRYTTERKRRIEHIRSRRAPTGLIIGMRVRIADSKGVGVLRRRLKNDRWQIETDTLRLTLPAWQLRPIEEPDREPRERETGFATLSQPPQLELDLRGYRLPEAEEAVRDQIDRAVAGGLPRFGIIHGTGTGVLQQGIRTLLTNYPMVERFEYAPPQQGGFGKTIVFMRGE